MSVLHASSVKFKLLKSVLTAMMHDDLNSKDYSPLITTTVILDIKRRASNNVCPVLKPEFVSHWYLHILTPYSRMQLVSIALSDNLEA